ncbi:hypothetical protein D3C74_49730 [compost metagenome]
MAERMKSIIHRWARRALNNVGDSYDESKDITLQWMPCEGWGSFVAEVSQGKGWDKELKKLTKAGNVDPYVVTERALQLLEKEIENLCIQEELRTW